MDNFTRVDPNTKAHYHKENGLFYICYHKCKSTISQGNFWVGVTITFPIEHFLWEKVWPFNLLTKFLGL